MTSAVEKDWQKLPMWCSRKPATLRLGGLTSVGETKWQFETQSQNHALSGLSYSPPTEPSLRPTTAFGTYVRDGVNEDQGYDGLRTTTPSVSLFCAKLAVTQSTSLKFGCTRRIRTTARVRALK